MPLFTKREREREGEREREREREKQKFDTRQNTKRVLVAIET